MILLKCFLTISISLILAFLLLLIPDPAKNQYRKGDKETFAWDRDFYWSELEARFVNAKKYGCEYLQDSINIVLEEFEFKIQILKSTPTSSDSFNLQHIEQNLFDISVLLGGCPDSLEKFIRVFGELRTVIKNNSLHWDLTDIHLRDHLYRILYGGRTAIEEVILQASDVNLPNVFVENSDSCLVPSADFLGVKIQSGDILVSRGGAPTSALIARGNDYPGNFSHIALVHVDDISKDISIIESHIEIGVAISNLESYIKDKKLRIMILRLRPDIPSLKSDPMLPHKAASYALSRAMTEKIAYDFAMDTEDPTRLFCSEVAFDAYHKYDLNLWSILSHISSKGVKNWLSAFGVENFITMEPSDLEYDPNIRVIAEWRDYETLYKDHLDNVVVDVMLESAENGAEIEYNWYMLPIVRIMKGYSIVLNKFNIVGPIPEGMNATAALKNEWFSDRHRKTVKILKEEAKQFKAANGYIPPYWELMKIARRIYGHL